MIDDSQERIIVGRHLREEIGATLRGDVLEVGPGHAPFPTAPDARVTYADRSVHGGRDATWPELVGEPWGPEAQIHVDLDVEGLGVIADGSFDVVIASHLIEHLANPIRALREFQRVLRPGGRLVLVVPDRTRTFDSVRLPTAFSHLFDEYERQVTEVDEEHIREFCGAIFNQPPIHPDEVRAWHDPTQLDEERFELHRRRTIHVHCWTPEEFAALVAGCLGRGLMSWALTDLYFFDDDGDQPDIEFGLVLERPRARAEPGEQSVAFVSRWAAAVLEDRHRDPLRLAALHAAVLTDLAGCDQVRPMASVLTRALATAVVTARATEDAFQDRLTAARADVQRVSERLGISEQRLTGILGSRSYRASRVLSGAVRVLRRRS